MSLTVCLLALIGHLLPASDSATPPIRVNAHAAFGNPLDADWMLTILIRKALFEDKDLGPLNVEVIVTHGTATLYGPVPSQYFGERAEHVVQQVPGVELVHNRLRIRFLPYEQNPPEIIGDPAKGTMPGRPSD
jgi:hypothetical protein